MSAQHEFYSAMSTMKPVLPASGAHYAPRDSPEGTSQQLGSGNQDWKERSFERIIGRSSALEAVLEEVELVAPTDSTVLIQGETGTGKELIAHAIHKLSSRSGRAFVRVNCAAIPLDLLESELFGHEKGAFTGAIAQRVGRFELADKGTLFLIGSANLSAIFRRPRCRHSRRMSGLEISANYKT